MFEERHIPNRRVGEHLVAFVRPHWLHLFKNILMILVIMAMPVVVYFLLNQSLPIVFEIDFLYVIIVFTTTLFYLMAMLILYNRFIDYHLDIWIITNFRIIAIVQNNIFNRTMSEHLLDNIQDVTANQKGFLQTFLNYGDIQVQTASEKLNFHFDDISKPFEIAKQINELVHHHQGQNRNKKIPT